MKSKLSKTEQGLLALLEKGKKDKNVISVLKSMAIKVQDYRLASELREIEKLSFPETKEEKKAKDEEMAINSALRMVGMNAPTDGSNWLLKETILAFYRKGNKFSLMDASKLQTKKDSLFRKKL